MIASPFDERVSFCARAESAEPIASPFPEELAALSPGAVERRRREFLLGRAVAHAAITRLLGSSPAPIGRGPRGEPLWPPGVVGTITHTRGIAAAAVAQRERCAGLGLDVEREDRAVKGGISRLVCTDGERAWAEADPTGARLKRLFAAKEAVFKALYPQAEVFLGYRDAELSETAPGFRAVLQAAAGERWPAGSTLEVGCRSEAGFLVAWVQLEA